MGQRTLGDVLDGLEEPRGGPGRVGGPSGWSRTGRGNLKKVQNELGDHRGGPGRVRDPSGSPG